MGKRIGTGRVFRNVTASAVDTFPSVSGLSARFAANWIAGASDGDALGSWSDLSGSGNNVTAASTNRPTYKTSIINGLPVVRFDGSNDVMVVASATQLVTTQATIFVVQKTVDCGSSYRRYVTKDGSYGLFAISNKLAAYSWGGGGNTTTQDVQGASANLLCFIYDSGVTNGSSLWLNGSNKGNFTYTKRDDGSAWCIGGNSQCITADVAEVVQFNRVLDATDRQTVETYLNQKYMLW